MEEKRRLQFKSEWVGRLLLSLILAVVLWGFVTSTRDPETDRVFSNVQIGSETLADGLTVVTDVGNATVTVTGPRSVVSDLVSTDIQASLDLDQVNQPGTYTVRVEVARPEDAWSTRSNPRSVSIVVEQQTARSFPVVPQYLGDQDSLQQVESFSPSVSEVTVAGPLSLVDRVVQVDLPIDIVNRPSAFAGVFTPLPVDANGQVIAGVTISPGSISASIEITTRGKRIAVITQLGGSPASGFEIVDRVINPSTVLVDGPEDVLDELITVNTDVVDVSGATEDISQTVNLIGLPDEVRLLDPASGEVQVVVQIRQRGVQQPLPSQQVTIVNLDGGLSASTSPNTVLVTVIGNEQELEQLSPTSLVVQVDVNDLGPGTYQLLPTVILPQNMEWTSVEPSSVTVTIVRNVSSSDASPSPVGSPLATPES